MKTRPVAPYILAVIGSLVLIVIAYAFFFTPKINDTAALDKQISETTAANDELQVLSDALAKKVSSISEAKGKVAEFNKAFPAEASQQGLIASILDAAAATGVTVTGINPAAPTAATGAVPGAAAAPGTPAPAPADPADPAAAANQTSKVFAVVPLTINAAGDQAALVVFMQRLEGLTRPFTAIEVTLVRGDGGSLLTLTGQSFIAAPLQEPAAKSGEPAEKAPEEKTEAAAPAPAAPAPAPTSASPSVAPSATAPAEPSAAATAPAAEPSEKK